MPFSSIDVKSMGAVIGVETDIQHQYLDRSGFINSLMVQVSGSTQ